MIHNPLTLGTGWRQSSVRWGYRENIHVLRNTDFGVGCFDFYLCKIFGTAPKMGGKHFNFAIFFAFGLLFCGWGGVTRDCRLGPRVAFPACTSFPLLSATRQPRSRSARRQPSMDDVLESALQVINQREGDILKAVGIFVTQCLSTARTLPHWTVCPGSRRVSPADPLEPGLVPDRLPRLPVVVLTAAFVHTNARSEVPLASHSSDMITQTRVLLCCALGAAVSY